MKIQKFKVNAHGLDRFFGPLEAKVMEVLWKNSEKTIKEVQEELEKEKAIKFNTVMTVMNRLVVKGFLEKRSESRRSYYKPVLSKEAFLNEQSKEMTHELMDEFGSVVVSHMLDALEEADPDLIESLEKKINDLKRKEK